MVRVDDSGGRVTIRFNRALYEPEAVFQAACSFFDRVLVLIDIIDCDIVVGLEPFDAVTSRGNIAREFCEHVYSYSAYMSREARTRDVREGLLSVLLDEEV
jgi:hypothetical protein